MIDATPNERVAFAGTAFFRKTYHEALDLVHEACGYIEGPIKRERAGLDFYDSLVVTCATTRLTARLTQLMAWMFVQRAVERGEMGFETANEEMHRLGPRPVCLEQGVDAAEVLPPMLADLMRRSEQLYRRVARLDDMLSGAAA